MIEIVAPGLLTTVQDLGRPGYGGWGIPAAGAADRASLRLANRLVGNPENAAGLEITLGGLRVRFQDAATIALTGAPCPITVDRRQAGMNGPLRIPAGVELAVGSCRTGLRIYLSVRGGIDVPTWLGSRSSDLQSGIGLPPLRATMELPVGAIADQMPGVDLAPVPSFPEMFELTVMWGPRADWFDDESLRTLVSTTYLVTSDCDRVGVRLSGAPLRRLVRRELPSEGVVRGAVEVPPNGQPIILLADYPTTCGYPVIALVTPESLDLAAQARPGQKVRFRRTSNDPSRQY